MRGRIRIRGGGLAVMAFVMAAALARAAGPSVTDEEVIDYLDRTITWQQRATALEAAAYKPQEMVFRDAIAQQAGQALQLGFTFGKAEAALLTSEKQPGSAPATGPADRLAQAAASANERVARIQTELDKADAELLTKSPEAQPQAVLQRDKLLAELNLAKARRDVVRNFMTFRAGAATGLSEKIDEMERNTPAAAPAAKTSAPAPGAAAAPANPSPGQEFRPESVGVLGLVSEMFTLSSRLSELHAFEEATARLSDRNENLKKPIRAELNDAIHRGDELSQTRETADAKTLAAERQEIDALAARYKLISSAIVPLGEQTIYLDSIQANSKEWRGLLERTYAQAIRAMILRVGGIVAAILILLGISSLWRRAAFRYVTDIRRRRQFLLIRRIIVGAVIVVILVAGIVTELSSLATFAGLITAGIAVALQTVILSGAAHFFFIGKYGVRVGDRVTISGVTGEVIEMGIFRLYLMELAGKERDLQPTGRVVVFSNSVLFQPTAFFKQLPGADFTWHEVALSLASDTDHKLAEERLLNAVASVVSEYSAELKVQFEALSESVHLPMPTPEPKARMRLVNSELECVVRYPVPLNRSAEIDDRITRKLVETIGKEPKLRLAGAGTPSIQPAEG